MKIIIKSDNELAQALTSISLLAPTLKDKAYEVEIKEYKPKRSLNANSYSWLLQGEIAHKLNRRIDDIHKEMVLQYGVIEVLSIDKKAFESAKRLFDYYEVLGESELNGKTFIHVKAGIGTHLYNTTEMAHFIDGIIAECDDLGIDHRTPDQIAEMKSLWSSCA